MQSMNFHTIWECINCTNIHDNKNTSKLEILDLLLTKCMIMHYVLSVELSLNLYIVV